MSTVSDLFAPLSGPDDASLAALHDRLVADAQRDQLLDVAYRTVDSPLGRLLLAATERGVVKVAFVEGGEDAALSELAARVSPRLLRAPARLDPTARELDEYFDGRRTGFDVPLDLQLPQGFRRTVLEHLRDIGYGSTESYGTVAEACGNPRAVRAVGSACARNPVPLLLPCHRVVRSDGSLGQYAGGEAAKRWLIQLESEAPTLRS